MNSFTPVSTLGKSRTFLAGFLTCIMLAAPLTPAGLAAETGSRLLLNQSKGAQKARLPQPGTTKNSPAEGVGQRKTPGVTQSIAAGDITATKIDTVMPDSLGDGKAQAGDTINYAVTIMNNSATDPASDVVFNDTIESNLTLVPDSIHASPLARNDAFTTVGNTLLEVGITPAGAAPAVRVAGNLFTNDASPTDPRSLDSFTQPTNGTVTVNADGSFTYLPNAGFTGPTDTFTYTIRNDAVPTLTDTATVTITISQMVWYVDSAAAAGGSGRSTAPFNTITATNLNGAGGAGDLDDADDFIYLFQGSYTTGLVLESGQQLVGNGVDLVVATFTLRTGSLAQRPTLSNTGGNALTLATNNLIKGLNLSAAANSAIVGSGALGATNISDVNTSVTGTGSGVVLTNPTGTFNYSGGGGSSLSSNSTGTAVSINGGNANVTFFGVPISQNAGRVVDIQNRTGGTVSFENGSTVTGTNGTQDAISLRNNTGGAATIISFSNTVNVATTSGGARALHTDNSTGNFTLNMTNASNVLSAVGASAATVGAAADLADIIGNLTFSSITSTNSAAEGVRVFSTQGSLMSGTTSVTNPATFGVYVDGSAANHNFGNTTADQSGGTGVRLLGNSGTLAFAALNIAPDTGQRSFHATSNTNTISSSSGAINGSATAAGSTTFEIVGVSTSSRTPLNMTLNSITTANDAVNGININFVSGNLTVSTTSVTNSTSAGIQVQNTQTGGTMNFGATTVNQTGGTGVVLGTASNGNLGPITFGALNIAPDPNVRGLHAVHNTNTITTSSGTINAPGSTAVEITGTLASNRTPLAMSLTKVDSNGGGVAGLILTNTSGSFATVGDNGGSNNGSGGIITAKSGDTDGVTLTDATNVSLRYMNITSNTRNGVLATRLNGFRVHRCNISNNANQLAPNESNLRMIDLSGSAINGSNPTSISNSVFNEPYEQNVELENSTAGVTLTNLQISDSSFTNAANPSGQGVNQFVALISAGTTTINVTGSTFTGKNTAPGTAKGFTADASGTGTVNANVGTSTFNTNNVGIEASVSTGGIATFNFVNNGTVTNNRAIGINIFTNANSTGSITGRIQGNVVGTNGVAGSGSALGRGIQVQNEGSVQTTVLISGNTVQEVAQFEGIKFQHGIAVVGAAEASDVTITGNTIRNINQDRSIISTTENTGSLCSDISGNTIINSPAPAFAGTMMRVRQLNGSHRVRQLTPTAAANAQELDDANGLTNTQVSVGGAMVFNGGTCTQPGNPAGPPVPTVPVAAPIAAPVSLTPDTAASPATSNFSGVTSGQPFIALPQTATVVGAVAPQLATGNRTQAIQARTHDVTSNSGAAAQESKTNAQKDNPVQPLQSGFPVNVGTLNPGESITITFSVTVNTNIPNNVTSVSNQGQVTSSSFGGTVLTDDPTPGGASDPTVTDILPRPTYTINNASVPEPTSGSVNMPFTVSLSHAYGSAVSVSFQTNDGTATAPSDYTSTSGTLNFAAGQLVQTISIPVLANGDTANEEFTVTLNTPVNSVLGANTTATGTITEANPPGRVLISEVRTSGPNGSGDDFVELYNNQNVSQDISGWAVFKTGTACLETPVLVAVIPANTTLPPRGHYLIVGPQYNSANFGNTAGNPTVAAVADIENDRNIALFNTSNVLSLSTATREDAVGFDVNAGGSNNCDLLREGPSLASAGGSNSQYSFARRLTTGLPKETNNNAADFQLVTTTPATIVGNNNTPALGAPGPENLAAPIQRNDVIKASLYDGTVAATAPPNRVRSSFGANPTNAAFGTLSIQRRFKNTLGVSVTRLRFRIVDLTTINNRAPGQADLRVLNSTGTVTNSQGGTITGLTPLTLEGPPQPNGGGLNSTLTVIPPGGALSAGNSIDVQFLLGVQEQGNFSFFVNVEALTTPPSVAEGAATKRGVSAKQSGGEATEPKEKQ